ncbi:hypothetical protein BV25DRAFT_1808303 [Artomyces pyxidatus]|uniref:Uncharacterized protein n=1 Tax=Artomyces pyxidatus TaxID=48021 RepID=A0ACB8SVU3_9AGAM|nr:hypothetical protein BV25DRAFT_1808303 [Artomyces pyxidatus]
MATRRTRSSRVLHQSPAFYACYLLKSIRTPRATATYIGSTPSPPRRIRQHNGEISQGAWKTKHNRPWVMQMIVYGFPSKLAALQFEWAWQHPHISRHLRDDEGKSLFSGEKRYIKTNIQVVQTMIACRPYNTWPLHVKLFTSEAVKIWGNVAKEPRTPPPPQGFTMKTELEGVDGKSGLPGSGRTGPIDISDESFTSVHLAKHTALLGSRKQLQCAVCHSDVHTYSTDSLSAALCPSSGCTAVSHLSCLSGHFLSGSTAETTLVPRGGECPVCRTYVLWGDVIKGCYRRHSGKAVLSDPEDTDGDEEGGDCEGEDELVVSANEDELVDQTTSKSPAPTRKAAKRLRVRADSVDVVPNAAKESPPKGASHRSRYSSFISHSVTQLQLLPREGGELRPKNQAPPRRGNDHITQQLPSILHHPERSSLT